MVFSSTQHILNQRYEPPNNQFETDLILRSRLFINIAEVEIVEVVFSVLIINLIMVLYAIDTHFFSFMWFWTHF